MISCTYFGLQFRKILKLTTDCKVIQRKQCEVSGKGGIVFVDNDRKVVKEYLDLQYKTKRKCFVLVGSPCISLL